MTTEFDATVRPFLDKYVNSFTKWELVQFFHANDLMADTAYHIAEQLRRNIRTVQSDLVALSEQGMVYRVDVENDSIYTLTEDEDIREALKRCVVACRDRQIYIETISHIMHRMR